MIKAVWKYDFSDQQYLSKKTEKNPASKGSS